MSLLDQQTDKRFLVFESQHDPNSSEETNPLHSTKRRWLWSDRLVLIEEKHNNEFWLFTAFDLLMDETRQIRFRKTNENLYYTSVYSLNDEFGFIVEKGLFNNWHINFVKFNWNTNEFQLIEHFKQKYTGHWILVDKMEPSKFVLGCYYGDRNFTYQLCKLVNRKIEFSEIYQPTEYFNLYSNDKLFCVNISSNSQRIVVYDLMSKKEENFEIDSSSLPKNVILSSCFEWVNDRLYASIYVQNTLKRGLAWVDLKTKRLTLMDFETNLPTYKLRFFDNNLIVEAKQSTECSRYSNVVKFFSIPMRKPNSLRQSAWLLVVKIMKNRGEQDPYGAAKEFLPLNSDLRAPWFKDVEN